MANHAWLLGAGSLLVSTAAVAQNAPAPPPAGAPGAQLQEIVVTAQRREQNLLSVPLSIQAATGEQLANNGIRDLQQLQFTTPGFSSNAGFGYTQVYIRGVGNNIYVGADPSVATYVDGVPRTFGTLQTNLVNVERVEVLKGAQGGLYGRNSTGGVVNIITRQPSDTPEADARILYGSKSTMKGSLYLNLPINDAVAWNFSAERDTHDFYIKDVATPNPYTAANFPTGSFIGTPAQTAAFFNSAVDIPKGVANQDFWSLDTKLRAKIGDNFKVTIGADYSRKQDSMGAGVIDLTPWMVQGTATALFQAYGINAVLPPGFVQGANEKFATTYSFGQPHVWLDDYGADMTAIYSLPFADITSITGYRKQYSEYIADAPYAAPPFVPEYVRINKHAVYQELRLTSTSSGRWRYIAGATFLATGFAGSTVIGYLPPLPLLTPTLARTNVKNWSVYGELGYDLTDALNLTVSGRYIHETNNTAFTSPLVSATSLEESKFLPSATLSYKLNGGGNAYARWARGIKMGGVNPVVAPSEFPTTYGSVFGPEEVDTYEIGYRAPLFDRSVQLTAALFYNDYKGLQAITNGNAAHTEIINAYINAGTARTYGAETSVTWRVTRPITLGVNAGYLNARYKSFKISDPRALEVFNPFDFSGQRMIYSPEWQVGINANLDQPVNDDFRVVGQVLASYTSDTVEALSTFSVLPNVIAPAYWLVNLRAGIRTADDKYELAVFANNLFNQAYYTVGNSSALGSVLNWGDPRIVGVELRARLF